MNYQNQKLFTMVNPIPFFDLRESHLNALEAKIARFMDIDKEIIHQSELAQNLFKSSLEYLIANCQLRKEIISKENFEEENAEIQERGELDLDEKKKDIFGKNKINEESLDDVEKDINEENISEEGKSENDASLRSSYFDIDDNATFY